MKQNESEVGQIQFSFFWLIAYTTSCIKMIGNIKNIKNIY